jgi:hypothetical protein
LYLKGIPTGDMGDALSVLLDLKTCGLQAVPLLAFYDFPTEHWQHGRTTNPIESTFAFVRHRITRARNCLSRATFLGLAFKLMG